MIKVENLTKRFGKVVAIDNLSFEVKPGEIVGFLGPNGAGKTTTMRVLSGFIPPTGGSVTIAGLDVFHDSLEVRRKIGYLPENSPIYMEMRVREYLVYRAKLKGLRRRKLRARVDEVLEGCSLTDVASHLIGKLSKGYRQRVCLADSLVHEPELLILDEPTIGLDPNQIRHIRNLIKNLAARHTVLLSSHILPEVEMICQRVLIINKGRIVASDTPHHLVGLMSGNPQVTAEICGGTVDSTVLAALQSIPDILQVTCEGETEWKRYRCECRKNSDVREAVYRLVSSKAWGLRELKTETRNLEDVFVAMTTEGLPHEEETPAETGGTDHA